jgi:hypothetical protein
MSMTTLNDPELQAAASAAARSRQASKRTQLLLAGLSLLLLAAVAVAGWLAFDNHAIITGSLPGSQLYPLTGEPVIGMAGTWIDTSAGITAVQSGITSAGSQGKGYIVRAHPELLNTSGKTTTAELSAFLDWLAARTDVMVLPLREFALATK